MENDREARELLRAYGAASAPDAARKNAAWAGIAAATFAAGGSGAAPVKTGASWIAKAGMALAVLGALGGAAWVGRSEHGREVEGGVAEARLPLAAVVEAPPPLAPVGRTPAPPSPRATAPVIVPAPVEAPDPSPTAVAHAGLRARAPTPAALTVVELPAAPPPPAASAPPVVVSGVVPAPEASGSLAAELAVLREAQRALRAGDAASALRGLEDHRSRFPDGALAHDREVARVAALCALGRDEEARALGAVLSASGESPAIVRALSRCVAAP